MNVECGQISMNVLPDKQVVVFMAPVMVIIHLAVTPVHVTVVIASKLVELNAQVTLAT